MKNIRKEIDVLYEKLKKTEGDIEKIRIDCPHNNTSTKDYSWRIGSIRPAELCDDCDKFIKYLDEHVWETSTTTTSETFYVSDNLT